HVGTCRCSGTRVDTDCCWPGAGALGCAGGADFMGAGSSVGWAPGSIEGFTLPSGPSRYASITLRATGPALLPPKPAFSTNTANAIRGCSAGAKATNQA